MIEDGRALFLQIAEQVEDSVVSGSLAEGQQAPSTNELALFYRVNPATAAKGMALLADKGILEKRRGVGMFVATGARQQLRSERSESFARRFIDPLLAEARTLGLGADELAALLRSRGQAAAQEPPTEASTTSEGIMQ